MSDPPFRQPALLGEPLLRTVFERLVLPLHNDGGVERVAMGGLIEDRPGT